MAKRKRRSDVEDVLDDLRALIDILYAKLSTAQTKIDELEILLKKRS